MGHVDAKELGNVDALELNAKEDTALNLLADVRKKGLQQIQTFSLLNCTMRMLLFA